MTLQINCINQIHLWKLEDIEGTVILRVRSGFLSAAGDR